MRQSLIQVGTLYFPPAALTSAEYPRDFYGTIDPSSLSGVVLSLGDVWWNTGGSTPVPPPTPSTRGALTIGTSNYTIPTGALFVDPINGLDTNAGTIGAPFQTVAHAISVVAVNGCVVCRGGTYHETMLTVSSLSHPFAIQAYPGEAVWFEGAQVVSSWTASGSVWVHTGVPTQFYRGGGVGWSNAGYFSAPMSGDSYADLSDQVFIDGVPLKQIADATTPGAGQFSVNYSANTITIGSTPVGHTVKVSDLRYFMIERCPVTMLGIGVRYYAPDNTGSICAMVYQGNSGTANGSVFENCVFEYSAFAGIQVNAINTTVQNCTFLNNTFNGGFTGKPSDGLLVDSCVFTNCNSGLFSGGTQCAAWKTNFSNGVTYNNNLVQNCNGAYGLWVDAYIIEPIITNNHILTTSGTLFTAGIMMEETDGGNVGGVQNRGVVAGNIVDGASFGGKTLASGHIDIYNNLVKNCSTMDWLVQKERTDNVNQAYQTSTVNPWDAIYDTLANNIFGGGTIRTSNIGVRYFDSSYPGRNLTTEPYRTADQMNGFLLNNQFLDSGINAPVEWGNANNGVVQYTTVAAFVSAEPTNGAGNTQGAMTDSQAAPMPANVAAALGVVTGTKKLGPYITT